MSDFLALDTLVLDPRFNGPPSSANGGYACGAIGELVDGPAEVTLLSPPPLGRPLGIRFRPTAASRSIGQRRRRRSPARGRSTASTSSRRCGRSLADAREASRRHPGHGRDSLFADCYVCGSRRHDGLGIHFGPLRGHADVTAAVFEPDATVPNRDGVVAPDIVWAALDCPSYTPPLWDWERPSLLARLAVERLDCVDGRRARRSRSAGTSPPTAASTTRPRRCSRPTATSSRAPARCGSRCASRRSPR